LFVAAKEMFCAMSTSVKDMAAGTKRRFKNRELPRPPSVVVTPLVKTPLATVLLMLSKIKFWVKLILDARAVSLTTTLPLAPLVETLNPPEPLITALAAFPMISITPAPLLEIVTFEPVIVIGPELNEPLGPMLLTTLPVVEKKMMPAPVEIARPVPADKLIVPVLDANPDADRAFSPLIEIVNEFAALAVCKLMFAPATNASDSAVPAMLVPDALKVFVPAAPPAAADN
jgi:hypothetical protein